MSILKERNEVDLLLAEIAYILMGIMFLIMGQYLIVIILSGKKGLLYFGLYKEGI